MHHEIVEDPEQLQVAIDQGHDHRDITFPGYMKAMNLFMIVSTVLIFLAILSGLGFFVIGNFFASQKRNNQQEYSFPWTRPEPAARAELPAGPLLQSNLTTKLDIKSLREEEDKALADYGRDAKTGKAIIPVDKAIELMKERGMPNFSGGTSN